MDSYSSINNLKFVLSDKEKYNKDDTASDMVKMIFEYYESHGFQQVYGKDSKYRKLYNLAHGKINLEDYISEEIPDEIVFSMEDSALDNVGLNFYPIIPNIRNAILGEYDKKYIKYSARAVNPENTNEIIDSMDSSLREILVKRLESLFMSKNPNPNEEERQMFMESRAVQDAYKSSYRTSIEQWAHHTMKREDLKYDMKAVERALLDQLIVTDDPVVHVNLLEDTYYPEVLNEKNCFYLKSTESDCYSESLMFGWFDYLNLGSILNKYGDVMTAEQIEEIETWISSYYGKGFTINGMYDDFTGNRNQDRDSIQNYITFKELEVSGRRWDDYNQDLFRETTIYFLLPRKVGKLTYRNMDVEHLDLVDELFEVTYKPVYVSGKPKTADYLIEGEHVDWVYINELWVGKKLDINLSNQNYSTQTPNSSSIWVELRKHPIQYSDYRFRYGISIPVYGGSVSNRYNESFSLVEKCSSWQIFYNWIWNRNAQLLATEVGRFFAFNQSAIPHESMGDTWGKDNLFKWVTSARDLSLAPLDTSLSNLGQSALPIHGGIGQVVDLNKTADILEKAQLANIVKQECYSLVGLTPEFLYGDISPYQSASSVMQGMQRSSSQIQYLYTRLHTILRRLRSGMLETAQYIESEKPFSQISYLTEEGARVIFKTSTSGFLLHELDVYIDSSLSDLDTLEKIKMYAAQNNTLGLDSHEMGTIMTSTSTAELLDRLKDIKDEKVKEVEKQRAFEQQQQQQVLAAQKEEQERELAYRIEKDVMDRENKIEVATMRGLGYANSEVQEIAQQMKDMQSRHDREKDSLERDLKERLHGLKTRQVEHIISKDKQRSELDERIRIKQIEQRDRELDLRQQDIEARNIRSEAID